MASKATKVYPIKGRSLAGAPTAVHVVPTKADADALVASGAFTLNPRDANRDDDAPDLGDEPLVLERTYALGEAPPEGADTNDEEPAEAGSSDSGKE
jgi:hypothetical protein